MGELGKNVSDSLLDSLDNWQEVHGEVFEGWEDSLSSEVHELAPEELWDGGHLVDDGSEALWKLLIDFEVLQSKGNNLDGKHEEDGEESVADDVVN